MSADAVLCRATPEDAADLAALHIHARASAMPWLAVVHTAEEVLQYFETEVLPKSDVWIARENRAAAGFIARREGWIDHLYLPPRDWRRGLGSRLLQTAITACPRLELWTFQRNEGARRFYESHGFAAAEFTDGSANEESEPDVRYVWTREANDGGQNE